MAGPELELPLTSTQTIKKSNQARCAAIFAAGLPRPTVAQAFEQLEAALQETSDWYGKIERVQDLISGIEKHRRLQSRCSHVCSSFSL